MNKQPKIFKTFEEAGATYVMGEAIKYGYKKDSKDWINFGQGSPEASFIAGAPQRIKKINMESSCNSYAPVSGLVRLRKKVADLYNNLYSKREKRKLSYENVDISGGGRLAISRIIAGLNNAKIAYFVPDYTAFEGVLSVFNNVKPCPIFLKEKNGFDYDVDQIEKAYQKDKFQILILSNPSNPTGNIIKNGQLKKLVNLARKYNFYIIFDEFYFNYVYNSKPRVVSVLEVLKDIEQEPIIVVSGLSKAWRYSGWRISWTIGSKKIINNLLNIGSFLDGGPNHPIQKATLKILNKNNLVQETAAIQRLFRKKRNYMIKNLQAIGFEIKKPPKGTFYIWAGLDKLNKKFQNSDKLFRILLKNQIITVPGRFFDINPFKKRSKQRFANYIRFSYGPKMEVLKEGIKKLKRILR
jgi:hypothetical protein